MSFIGISLLYSLSNNHFPVYVRTKGKKKSAVSKINEVKKNAVIFLEYDGKYKYIMNLSSQILLQQFLWPMTQGLQKDTFTR